MIRSLIGRRQCRKRSASICAGRQVAGMTLIEVMIVVAIVSVLLLAAVPGYRGYVLRSHRVEAQTALLGIATTQEMFYLRHNTYTSLLEDAPPDGLGLQSVSANGHYALRIVRADTDGFEATATAAGTQVDDGRCLAFSIDQVGTKSATSADCWSR